MVWCEPDLSPNCYKEVVWLARERRGNNWSCSERSLVRSSWRSSGWTEMNPVWDKNWRGNWRGSCSRTNVALLLLSTMPESPSISNTRVPQLRRVNSQTWPPSTLLSPGASGGWGVLAGRLWSWKRWDLPCVGAAGLNTGKPGVLAASVGGRLVPPCLKELEMKTRARGCYTQDEWMNQGRTRCVTTYLTPSYHRYNKLSRMQSFLCRLWESTLSSVNGCELSWQTIQVTSI